MILPTFLSNRSSRVSALVGGGASLGSLLRYENKILGQISQKCGHHSTGCLNTYLKVPNERRNPAVRLIVMLLVG